MIRRFIFLRNTYIFSFCYIVKYEYKNITIKINISEIHHERLNFTWCIL